MVTVFLNRFFLVSILLGVKINSYSQDEYNRVSYYSHNSATTRNPRSYSENITPPLGYYIINISYQNNNRPTCGWCYPSQRINSFGLSGNYSVKCDGGPCNFNYTIRYRKMRIDSLRLKITKDPEENLSSTVWAENKGGIPLTMVYKVESYNPATARYDIKYNSISLLPFNRAKVIPRFKRIDTSLYEEFLTPVYTQ